MNVTNKSDILSPSGKYKIQNIYNGHYEFFIENINDKSRTQINEVDWTGMQLKPDVIFNKDGQEWLWLGKRGRHPCFINMDTSEIFKGDEEKESNHDFYWCDIHPNPSGTILAVHGCIWACNYETIFIDFSDPKNGWKVIGENHLMDHGSMKSIVEYKWLDDDNLQFTLTEKYSKKYGKSFGKLSIEQQYENHMADELSDIFYYKVDAKRLDDHFIFEVHESDIYKQDIQDSKERRKKLERNMEKAKESNQYKTMKSALEPHNVYIPYNGVSDIEELNFNNLKFRVYVINKYNHINYNCEFNNDNINVTVINKGEKQISFTDVNTLIKYINDN